MGFLRKNIRRVVMGGLSLTLCASLTASTVMFTSADGNGVQPVTQSLGFEDVTGKFNANSVREQNFSDSVLAGTDKYTPSTRTVIVGLEGENILEYTAGKMTASEYLGTAEGRHALRNIESEQRTFLNNLNSKGISYYLKSSYAAIGNAVAIEVNSSDVSKIRTMNGVKSVVYSQTYLVPQTVETTTDNPASDITNDANVYATGIYDSSAVEGYDWGTGNGTIVAILDTGLDYTHRAFQRVGNNLRFTKSYVESKLTSTEAYKRIAEHGSFLTADDLYISDKVAFAFDYADNDADVYPSYSNHGTHVAGIVAGYDETGYDKDDVHYDEYFKGVAPDAQLMICKVFTDDLESEAVGGAESEDILSALEDCVTMGVDVINMSLGTTSGFTLTEDEADAEGQMMFEIFDSIRQAGISLICAASNDYSAGYGSNFGTNLTSNPDSGTVGSPSTYYSALSVASISGQKSKYLLSSNNDAIFYDESSDGNSVPYNFQDLLFEKLGETGDSMELEYVVVSGIGAAQNYIGLEDKFRDRTGKSLNRLALVKRGETNFQDKVELACEMGAVGIIVYNNVSGKIRMSLGDVKEQNFIPAVSITLEAGNKLVAAASDSVGKITVDKSLEAGPFMSEFSSWGVTSDLILKPEITAHGGEITSTVPGGYAEQSGTSMASPNMAGLTALVRNYIQQELGIEDDKQVTRLANQLIMSTATTVRDETGLAYSPRKQGSGLASLSNIISTSAYLFTDEQTDGDRYYNGKDYRPKVELGDDKDKKGEYSFKFKVANFGDTDLQFTTNTLFMTETLSVDKLAVAEKAYMLQDKGVYTVTGGAYSDGILTVAANTTATVGVTLKLTADEKKYLNDSFENGMFVEGFIQLIPVEGQGGQCTLNLPFVGFYGDWEDMPLLDYDAFEIADSEQDANIQDELKLHAAVFGTQAYANYNNGNYVIPMGSFLYVQDENDTQQIYADRDHCAVSRFNEYLSDDGVGNYLTAYTIKCVYAGLLRNSKKVVYNLYDSYTGELITSDTIYRVGKAFANGGSATPAFIEFNIDPYTLGLLNNGKYTMDFEFYFTGNETEVKEENKFSFDFYVDYEAPVLQDVRVRYDNYKDANNNEKQRIYLDIDVFDNHYAQSVMLCYYDVNSEIPQMNLVTEYITPVKNAVKNGTTTVSIEVTDIWDQYKDVLALQVDDYALNHSMYILSQLDGNVGTTTENVNASVTPATFELAAGEDRIVLGLNETHKVSLVYEGNADLSNFEWRQSPYVSVQNGVLYGRRVTGNNPAMVHVSNRKGVTKTIYVTVVDNGTAAVANPSLSFSSIENSAGGLVKAEGTVKVNAGEDFVLNILTDPWYFDQSKLDIVWESTNPNFATVEGVFENGSHSCKIHTIAEGVTQIRATINGTIYRATVSLSVQDPFTISNMTLTAYHGDGINDGTQDGVVIIPDGKNIMTIGDEAFKDNTKITKVIIPKTVTQIGERAFIGCTNLKEVYFISEEEVGSELRSNLTLISKRAFYGLPSLEKVDLTNVKVITVAKEVFADCTKLKTVVNSPAIGTAHARAFMGCSSLTSYDLSGLHVSGENVFSGCTSLAEITTNRYTALGYGMFAGFDYVYQVYEQGADGNYGYKPYTRHYDACTSLGSNGAVVINTPSVGESAFAGCTALTAVTFNDVSDISIGVNAFNGCDKLSQLNLVGNSNLKSVGYGAFVGTHVDGFGSSDALIQDGVLIKYSGSATSYTVPAGVTKIGAYAFADSNVTNVDLSNVTLTEIGAYAFEGTKITSFVIPASVTVLGDGVFRNCSKLTSVTFEAGSTLTEIPVYAFNATAITSIVLPSTVTVVGNAAFAQTPITEFHFAPANNAVFGSYVFRECGELVSISLAGNIVSMGDAVFANCAKLQNVTLPSLTTLGAYTFSGDDALRTVEFGGNAKTTGSYTFFNLENLTSVTLGSPVAIGEAAFYGCTGLTSINLAGAKIIEKYAFYGCDKLATVTGIANVTDFGDYSFANCSALDNFSIASAENIGDYVFYGAKTATEVTVPATLKSLGAAAFANNSTLSSYAVANGNKLYFVNDGVLYKNVGGGYVLVAFPTAKTVAVASDDQYGFDGKKVYRVLDGTISVESGAFRSIARGRVEVVILPYTLKSIGDRAFYNTDIYEYCFESINAPVLQSTYNAVIDSVNDTKNYYLANFVEEIYLYHAGASNVADLTIYRPENGIGYTNLMYSTYFSANVTLGVLPEDDTRAVIELIDSFPASSVISGWNKDTITLEELVAFSDKVTEARRIYRNTVNEAQLALIGDERAAKLTDTETALRAVKEIFGIQPKVTSVTYTTDETFKSTYKAGETLDWTGLTIIAQYDDGSTAIIPHEQCTLLTEKFTPYSSYASISVFEGVDPVRVVITIVNDDDKPDPGPDPKPPMEDDEGGCGGCNGATGVVGTVVSMIAVACTAAVVTAIIRRKSRNSHE